MRQRKIPTLLHWENLRKEELRGRSVDPLVRMESLEEDLKKSKDDWEMRDGYLSNSNGVMVDFQDFFWVDNHIVGGSRYPEIRIGEKIYRLHNLILPSFNHLEVDHRNRNKFDNRRENLRLATSSQNKVNRDPCGSGKSKFRGVSLKPSGKWRASIGKNRKLIWLGDFQDEVMAAKAYDEAALKEHGEFAMLNFQ